MKLRLLTLTSLIILISIIIFLYFDHHKIQYNHCFYSARQSEQRIRMGLGIMFCKLEDGSVKEFTMAIETNDKQFPELRCIKNDFVYLGIGKFDHFVK